MRHLLRYLKPEPIPEERQKDCSLISAALWASGIPASQEECYHMWQNYSDSVCAGWIIVPKDTQEIVDILVEPYSEDWSL